MIDISKEKPLRLADAAKLVPPTREGKPTGVSCLTRWIINGSSGVKLEAIRMGGRWLTSAEALQRFGERITAAKLRSPVVETAGAAERQERARLRLRARGMKV